jgi:glutaredoxin
MQSLFKVCLGLLLFISLASSSAETTSPSWVSSAKGNQVKLQVYLFLSSVCPHCHKADEFFRELETNTAWLEVHRYTINTDKAALAKFNDFLKQQNSSDFSVPGIFFCNSHWVGFGTAQSSGRVLLRALTYCHDQVSKTGQLTPITTKVLRQWADANWFESNRVSDTSATAFVPLMAMSDGLNPCSIFCILALFAFLWLKRAPALTVMTAVVFAAVVAVVHVMFQLHTAFFFILLSWLRFPALLVGGLLLAYACNYFKLIEENNYAFITLVALTAFTVQAYMQTCTPNLALIFEQWLSSQSLTQGKIAVFEIIYQSIYLLPLFLLLLIVSIWRRSSRMMKYENIITRYARLLLIFVALLLIVYPLGLSIFWLSAVLAFASILLAILFKKSNLFSR